MKLFKSSIFGLTALALSSFAFTACQDDVDAPNIDVPVASQTPNMTLAEFKEMFWQDDNNYCVHAINPEDPTARVIIHGRVISSDEQGNVFKFISIQDETAALTFSVDSYNLYLNYRMGQDIVFDATDLFIGKYAGLQQMGDSSYYDVQKTPQVTFMSLERFQSRAELNGIPELSKIDTLKVESFSDLGSSPELLRKYQSQLVCLKNVYFEDAGEKKFSEYHVNTNEAQNRNIIDRYGNTLIVRTSGYSTFWNEVLPSGNLDITGVLTYFNGSWRLVLNDRAGVVSVGDRPGSQDKPYTVEEAIALEESGNTDNGWVKGYIVGAVAPEVESVTKNEDIQWEAPTVLANTLVIGATTATNDITKCLVIALPAESPLREYCNLRNHPENLGKELAVKGNLEKYMGTYGITGNGGAVSEFKLEGLDIDPNAPTGEGTANSPYNIAKALEVIAAGPATTEVYVKGKISSIKEIDTGTYGNATYNISDDGSTTAAQLIIYRGKGLNGAKFTSADQLAVGATVVVKGVLINFMDNTPEMSQGSQIISYNGEGGNTGGGDTPNPPATGSGTGTREDPYDCAAIISLNPTSTQDAVATGVWAQGYIVGSIPTGGSSTVIAGTVFGTENAAASNLVLGPTPDCKDTNLCITVQLASGSAARSALNLLDNPGNLGKKVAIKGDVMKYCGAPGLKNVSEFTLDGQGGGGNTGGDTPNPPTGNAIYSSLEASLSALPSDWTIENTTLPEGATYIWNWKVYNGSGYLNGSAYVNGALTAEAYAISPVIDLTGATGCELNFEHAAKFQTTLRTLCGVVVREEGSTTWTPLTVTAWPEAGSWNFAPCTISLNAYDGKKVQIAFKYGSNSTGADTWEIKNLTVTSGNSTGGGGNTGGDTPGGGGNTGGDTPDTPDTPSGDGISILASAMTVPGATTVSGYTVDVEKAGSSSTPILHESTATVRVYAKGTIQVSGPKMAKIVFTVNDSSNKFRYTTLTPTTGTISPAQATGDTTVTWVGNATDVTFTVGDLGTLGSEPGKPGQFHFTKVEIYPAD